MALPKHDYDSEEFYALLQRTASVCAYDKDVALILDLSEERFSCMKNGKYEEWTPAENKRRGERIRKVLARARAQSNVQVWNTILKLGVGMSKSRSRSVRGGGVRCSCNGKKKDCELCHGSGWYMNTDADVDIQETETELAPSLQAMTLWLHHHDPNYRKMQKGEAMEEDSTDENGFSVDSWIRRESKLAVESLENSQEDDSQLAGLSDNPTIGMEDSDINTIGDE